MYGDSPLKMTVGDLVTCAFRTVEPGVGTSVPDEWAPLAGLSLHALFLPSWLEWNASLKVNTLGWVGCPGKEKAIRKQVFSKAAPHTPCSIICSYAVKKYKTVYPPEVAQAVCRSRHKKAQAMLLMASL